MRRHQFENLNGCGRKFQVKRDGVAFVRHRIAAYNLGRPERIQVGMRTAGKHGVDDNAHRFCTSGCTDPRFPISPDFQWKPLAQVIDYEDS